MKTIFAVLALVAAAVASPSDRRQVIRTVELMVTPGNEYGVGLVGTLSAHFIDCTIPVATSTLTPSFTTAQTVRLVTDPALVGITGCTAYVNADCTGKSIAFGQTATDVTSLGGSIGCYFCA